MRQTTRTGRNAGHEAEEPPRPAIEHFTEQRDLLFGVAYHLLGSVQDAEDVLQESWPAWSDRFHDRDQEPVENPRGYLVRLVTNQALARKRLLERRKENYLGSWLPEPIVQPESGQDGEQAAVRTEAVSLAMLVVLESLGPTERAVFVLREVFGFAHAEIAEILGNSDQAVRQTAHRAREHVRARRPRYRADPAAIRRATRRFLSAALGGDLEALLRVLAPEVVLCSDGGGQSPVAGPRPVYGSGNVSRLAASTGPRQPARVSYRTVNGDPGAVLYRDDQPLAVITVDLDEQERVNAVYVVSNPDKFGALDHERPDDERPDDERPDSERPDHGPEDSR